MQADELDGMSIGGRIQAIRERRGKSRPVIANLVGRSAQWLKDVERGRRLAPRWEMLVALAEVLHVDVATVTGSAPIAVDLQRREGHPVVADLREAIESIPLTLQREPEPDVSALQRRAAEAWALLAHPFDTASVGRGAAAADHSGRSPCHAHHDWFGSPQRAHGVELGLCLVGAGAGVGGGFGAAVAGR